LIRLRLDRWSLVDRRVVGVAVAILGVLLGIAGTTSDAGTVAVAAGALALVGGVATARLVGSLREAMVRIGELDEQVDTLQTHLSKEVSARADAERTLSSRVELTATRRATEDDALLDASTGLYSEGWFTVAVDAGLTQARRDLTPVAIVLMDIVRGLDTGQPEPLEPASVATAIHHTVRENDTACRLLDGGYALVLGDTDDSGAVWTVERIRRLLTAAEDGLTLWAGIACFPAHGLTVDEVLDRADLALDAAREWRQDRIEVAVAPKD